MSDRNNHIDSEIRATQSSIEYLKVKLELNQKMAAQMSEEEKDSRVYESEAVRYQDLIEEEQKKLAILQSMK